LALVAGREDDTRADDHRPPDQAGIVTLLDRRVERVEVSVQDRCLITHEHMFAQRAVNFRSIRELMPLLARGVARPPGQD
jgi:hypothetical protein